jgi:anti-anti-sigma factor
METKVTSKNGFEVVAVSGRLDTIESPKLEKKLVEILDAGKNRIVLDCEGVDYVSSSGLRVFLLLMKRTSQSEGRFYLANIKPDVREVIDISGFSKLIGIYDTVDQAVNA